MVSYKQSSRSGPLDAEGVVPGRQSTESQQVMSRFAIVAFSLAAILSAPALAQMPSQDFFPIGVFSQPSSSFDKWKGRGVNSLFQYEGQNNSLGVPTVTMDQWSKAAASKGMYYARTPGANPADDLQEKYLLAWTQSDEPDLENHNPIPSLLIDKYQNLKAISPSKPVWVNFAGNHVTPAGSDYTQWVKGGDWLSHDWYPFNTNPSRYPIDLIGMGVDKLRASSKGVPKKYFACIESSFQNLSSATGGRAPTTDEFRGEVWEAIVHGATGIVYFPQQIGGGFLYDATPSNLVAEMTTQNARIQSLARVLNSPFNPSTRGFSSGDARLEATWRSTTTGEYLFVLNESNTTASGLSFNFSGLDASLSQLEVVGENRYVSLGSGGVINDTFSPYQVHVYHALPVIGSGAVPAVPEPAGLAAVAIGLVLLGRRRSR